MRISAGLTAGSATVPIDPETLVRQVRHRVTDDLQVVIGLLLLQAIQEPNEAIRERLRDAAERVRSLPAFYDMLCREHESGLVDASAYLREVCAQLEAFHAAERRPIRCRLEVTVRRLPLAVASRLGLIINELVVNGSKEIAETAAETREIHIALYEDGDGCVLELSDGGSGPRSGRHHVKSMGTRLIAAVVAQLQGMLIIHRDHRTRWTIAFPLSVAC